VQDAGQLAPALARHPGLRWVQLSWAGVEPYADLLGDGRTWTCAKGVFGDLVAEHALMLAIAGLRDVARLVRARSWQGSATRSLFGARVTVVGGGGIAESLLALLAPFRASVTVVRRHPRPMAGAARVVGSDCLLDALAGADVVVLTPALTPETAGMIGERELRAMGPRAWLVNVARGALVVTDDLVRALREGWISGAALDVTDPEPLPPEHPLWRLDNCLVTPHVAGPLSAAVDRFAERITENVRRYGAGEPLIGLVDPALGY
jgi:phosphoglycerate dehydrogenase-like enzyme